MADADASRWDAKYQGRPMPTPGASQALREVEAWIPGGGRALDVAGGDGAQAVWLAQRGLDVTLCDVSAVALLRAASVAAAAGVELTTVRVDLEAAPPPSGPWTLTLCTNYLQPSVWPALAEQLAVGGVAIWLHPTVENLERNAKPSRRFLLDAGQAREVFESAGLAVVHADEGWIGDRHLASVIGRRDA